MEQKPIKIAYKWQYWRTANPLDIQKDNNRSPTRIQKMNGHAKWITKYACRHISGWWLPAEIIVHVPYQKYKLEKYSSWRTTHFLFSCSTSSHYQKRKEKTTTKNCAIKKCRHTYMVTEETISQKQVQRGGDPTQVKATLMCTTAR